MDKKMTIASGALLVAVYLMRFFYVPDPLEVALTAMLACVALLWWHKTPRLTVVDLGVGLMLIYMTISACFLSENITGSMGTLLRFVSGVAFYLLARTVIARSERAATWLFAVLTGCITVLSAMALVQFAMFASRIHAAGFGSVYDFRYLFCPLGVPVNEWNSLQWLWGAIALIAYFNSKGRRLCLLACAAGCMVWVMTLLSFSRGGYIAVAVCVVVMVVRFYGVPQLRDALRPAAAAALLAAVLCVPFGGEMLQTLHISGTASQQRSTESRMEAAGLTLDIVADHPWGTGAGTYTLAKDLYQTGESRSDSYTSFAPNILVQVLVEYGWAGLALFCVFIGIIIWYIIDSECPAYLLIAAFLLGFLIKEQTFPTFFTSAITQMSVLLLLAYMQRGTMYHAERDRITIAFPVALWIIAAVAVWYIYDVNRREEREDTRFLSEMDTRLIFGEARNNSDLHTMETLADRYPDRLDFRWKICQEYIERDEWEQASEQMRKAVLWHPQVLDTEYFKDQFTDMDIPENRMLKEAIEEAIAKRPDDPIRLAKYGSIALKTGHTDMAERYLTEASGKMPSLSMVWANLAEIERRKGNKEMTGLYTRRWQLLEYGIFAGGNDLPDRPVVNTDIWKMGDEKYRGLYMMWYSKEYK